MQTHFHKNPYTCDRCEKVTHNFDILWDQNKPLYLGFLMSSAGFLLCKRRLYVCPIRQVLILLC